MREKHINMTDWERYLRGELPVAELLDIDVHVSACQACRKQFTEVAPDVSGARQIQLQLEGAVHLSFEQMERFVDGGGSREERALVTGHTAHCSSCKDELGDLAAYARSQRTVRPAARPAARWISAAAALLVAIGLTLMWLRHPSSTPMSPASGARNEAPAPGVRPVAPPAAESSVKAKLEPNSGLGPNAGKREVQLGVAPNENLSDFRLVGPVGARVLDLRPVLRWSPAPGADYYLVQVFDADFRLAASSPQLSQTEWRVPRPLKPGKIYSWQVTAKQAGRSITAPQPPAPQALFEVNQSASDQSALPRATKPAQ